MILTTLYSFSSNVYSSPDGSKPVGKLLLDSDGNLFGTAGAGGSRDSYGTEFEFMKDGTGYALGLSNLITFDSYSTGYMPSIGMISDAAGNLFGVSDRTVYELAKVGEHYAATRTILAWTESSVRGGLIMDAAGNMFGVTDGGTFGNGTVFEIVKTATGYASTATTLVTFNGTNGKIPGAGLIMDSQGNLFGTTFIGGTNGYGTVFEIAKTANGYASTPTVLYNFEQTHGSQPSGGLLMDFAGNLFGVTSAGGAYGKGTVFEIERSGSGYASTPTIIVSFNGINGSSPAYDLTMDGLGNLYGVTRNGGVADKGTVYAILKDGNGYANTVSTLWEFNGSNGANPSSGLVMDSWGHIFGTTYTGGANGGGTIFELSMVAPLTASISGTAQQGQTLTASADGGVIGYQWQELVGGVWTDLYGETGTTYAVKAIDAGRQIRVEAFGSDGRLGISRASNSVLDGTGNQLVYESAIQTTIGSSFLQSVYGYAANATIASGGQQNIYAGGRADQTIVNAGGAQVDWGMLAHTTLNGGSQYVYGTSDATVINSGLQVIESGGAASATIIHGGEQDVVDGGSATGTTMDGGIQVVYGTVSQTVLIKVSSSSGSIQHLHGVSNATSLYGGGQQNVYADGTAIGTRVAGGSQFVWGTSTGGSVESGKQYAYGTVTDTKVGGPGARQDVQSGGHAVNDTLSGSGIVWVHAGGSLDGLVSLTESFNQLVIEDSSTFNATISAWQPNKNTIDLVDIHFTAGSTSLAYAQNSDNTGGALTVTDGTHTATLHLLGQYSAANFHLSADNGYGGTLITEVVAPAQAQLAAALTS